MILGNIYSKKGGIIMATSTFDKVFVIEKAKDKKALIKILASDEPAVPPKKPLYSIDEMKQSEDLLKKCLSVLKV